MLHANVRSLAANHDKLTSLISDLTHNFHLLGISETKIRPMAGIDPVANVSVAGYNYISQPSNQNAGGVGFYIRSDCELHSRDNLSISTADFECLWIEIHSKSHRNTLCSVIYIDILIVIWKILLIFRQKPWIKFLKKIKFVF